MSEPEKKSGGGAGGSSVVLVEQSAASRHKQPFRPTELQEEASDLHHKRSRAPAVPSVTEELKDNANTDTKDRRESERAMSSEKQKQSIAKKLSGATKRRGSSPETITLAKLELDTKRGTVTPPAQPIPAQVASVASADLVAGKRPAEDKEDDDSITDEIADLRTPEVAKRSSEWVYDPQETSTKRKAVSWHHNDYPDKVKLQESRACVLERKSSIGPCFRSSAPFGRPSGIAISLPNKLSRSNVDESYDRQSLINITVSKVQDLPSDWPHVKFFGSLKGKLANMTEKLKEVLNA